MFVSIFGFVYSILYERACAPDSQITASHKAKLSIKRDVTVEFVTYRWSYEFPNKLVQIIGYSWLPRSQTTITPIIFLAVIYVIFCKHECQIIDN